MAPVRLASASLSMAFVVLVLSLPGCGVAQRAAARDPMKCERDPECVRKRGKYSDCSSQCNDDPACMDRCAQMSNQFR
jgi:hypothetical protein